MCKGSVQAQGGPRVSGPVETGQETSPEMERWAQLSGETGCYRTRLGSLGKAWWRRGSPGSALVQVPLLAVSDVPSTAEIEAVDDVSGAVTVPALQLRRPGPGVVVSDPRLQAREQNIRPRRGRKGRPSRGRPQRLQQKQRSDACQCWPS